MRQGLGMQTIRMAGAFGHALEKRLAQAPAGGKVPDVSGHRAGPYFSFTLALPNVAMLKGSFGLLDAKGQAMASFVPMPGLPPEQACRARTSSPPGGLLLPNAASLRSTPCGLAVAW